jgi:hypothetical protein
MLMNIRMMKSVRRGGPMKMIREQMLVKNLTPASPKEKSHSPIL